jgi:hypothetical protein
VGGGGGRRGLGRVGRVRATFGSSRGAAASTCPPPSFTSTCSAPLHTPPLPPPPPPPSFTSTWRAPLQTAASELAVASPRSLWQCVDQMIRSDPLTWEYGGGEGANQLTGHTKGN